MLLQLPSGGHEAVLAQGLGSGCPAGGARFPGLAGQRPLEGRLGQADVKGGAGFVAARGVWLQAIPGARKRGGQLSVDPDGWRLRRRRRKRGSQVGSLRQANAVLPDSLIGQVLAEGTHLAQVGLGKCDDMSPLADRILHGCNLLHGSHRVGSKGFYQVDRIGLRASTPKEGENDTAGAKRCHARCDKPPLVHASHRLHESIEHLREWQATYLGWEVSMTCQGTPARMAPY